MNYLTGSSNTFGGVLCCADDPEPFSTTTTTTTTTTEEPVSEWTRPDACENNTCDCSEDSFCSVCQSHGLCSQCMSGYFKLNNNYACTNCQEVFGNGCMFCQDFNGCGQCGNGFTRTYDSLYNVHFCRED